MNSKSWEEIIEQEQKQPYFKNLEAFIDEERRNHVVYPPKESVFNAFKFTPLDKVQVVILGQDPYHGPDQSIGLSFAINDQVAVPPSLRNILKELKSDLNIVPSGDRPDLVKWAQNGVLLLNNVLTVREHEPNSHANLGWEKFTDKIISELSNRGSVVFVLWGRKAQVKKRLIDGSKNLIIEAPHPSPFSANKGFFGSKPFSKVNNYLRAENKSEVDWNL